MSKVGTDSILGDSFKPIVTNSSFELLRKLKNDDIPLGVSNGLIFSIPPRADGEDDEGKTSIWMTDGAGKLCLLYAASELIDTQKVEERLERIEIQYRAMIESGLLNMKVFDGILDVHTPDGDVKDIELNNSITQADKAITDIELQIQSISDDIDEARNQKSLIDRFNMLSAKVKDVSNIQNNILNSLQKINDIQGSLTKEIESIKDELK